MRTAIPFRLLLLSTLALAAAGCDDDSDSPFEPLAEPAEQAAPLAEEPAALVSARWADAYLLTFIAKTYPYTPSTATAYNRAGGPITVNKVVGTTGRYIATFSGLSAVLGTKSTVHVTAYGADNSFCKPMTGYVVSDKVEVRCFHTQTGAPWNTDFSLVVLRKTATRAFAFAQQPTTASYTPSAAGSWNPAGTIKVIRHYTGYYQVLFNNLGTKLSANLGGHVQVHTVGSGKSHCKASDEWAGSPNLSVTVQCWTLTGQPVDARFNVLVQLPASHVGYTYANIPQLASYAGPGLWSSNPTGGSVTIRRSSIGQYTVTWAGIDPEIVDYGNIQVTGLGYNDSALCKMTNYTSTSASVKCFAASGLLVDTFFTVLMGS